MTPLKVVSLVPSATETLLALGVTPIACTRFCEQPGIETVGGTKDPDVAAISPVVSDKACQLVDVTGLDNLARHALHRTGPVAPAFCPIQ